jgi:hypothetical protein
MDLKEYSVRAQHLRHPWEQARAAFFKRLVHKWSSTSQPLEVLDMGSGDMWLARQLLTALPACSRVTCVDSSLTSEILGQLNLPSEIETFREVPALRQFDRIFLLDVVEHVHEDVKFLTNLRDKHLSPGGLMVISVPAYQRLFTAHDHWLGHYRRYAPSNGRRLLRAAGLQIVEEGALFHCLLYGRTLEKLIEMIWGSRPPKGVAQWTHGKWTTRLVTQGLNVDWRITELFRKLLIHLPGLSWWCVCKRA